MFEYIEKLRQKPESAKKRIAFLTALTFCGIIGLIWISVVFPDIKSSKEINDKASLAESGPTNAIAQTFSDGFKAIGAQFSKIKEGFSMFGSATKYESTTTNSTETGTSY